MPDLIYLISSGVGTTVELVVLEFSVTVENTEDISVVVENTEDIYVTVDVI